MIIKKLPTRYENVVLQKESVNSLIFSAYDKLSKRKVAVKLISKTSSFYQGVYDEFKILFQFQHPNLVEVTDYGLLEDVGVYYVMPFYEKIEPISYCKKKGIDAFLNIFFQLLCGLHFLHQRRKRHGDLTLDNLILTKAENQLQVRISDFGLSSLIAADKISDISGTAKYLAPELLSKPKAGITFQSDLYALGIVLYEMSSGKAPFEDSNSLKLMQAHLQKKVPALQPNFALDGGIENIIYKLLEKNPVRRYKNCREVLQDLNPFLVKYNLQEKNGFFWENVLRKIRIEKKIGFNFYRKKQVDYFGQLLIKNFQKKGNNRIIGIIGGENNSLQSTLKYVFYELRNNKLRTVLLDDFSETDDYLSIISAQLPAEFSQNETNNFEQIIIFSTQPLKDKARAEKLFSFVKNHKNMKLIIAVPPAYSKYFQRKDIDLYRLKTFSREESEQYLEMYFGKNVLPEKLKQILLTQSRRDLQVLNDFIDYYIEKGVISYKNLRWHFQMQELEKEELPPKIRKYFERKFKLLEPELQEIMRFAALWKKSFLLKETAEVLSYSLIKVSARIDRLKNLNLLVQPAKSVSFHYPFLRNIVCQNSEKNELNGFRRKIISYLEKRKELLPEEEMLLFSHYANLPKNKKMLSFGKALQMKFKKNIEKIIATGKEIFKHRKELEKIGSEDVVFLLNNYAWALDRIADYELALSVFREVWELGKSGVNQNLKNEIFVRNLYFLNRESKFAETISIYEQNRKFIENLPDLPRTNSLQHISFAFKETEKPSEQKRILREILNICKGKEELLQRKGISLDSLAFAEYRSGNSDKALNLFKESAAVAEKLKDFSSSAFTRCRIANIFVEQYRYDEALKQLQIAERLMKKTKVKYPLLVIHNTYGNLFLAKCDFWKSLQHYHRADRLFREQKEDYSVPMGNKGFALNALGYYRSSIELTEKTVEIKKKMGQKSGLGIWLTNSAFAYYKSGNEKTAMEIFRQIQKMENEKTIPITFMAHFYLIDFALAKRNLAKAEKHLEILNINFEDKDTDDIAILLHFMRAKYYFEKMMLKKARKQIEAAIKKTAKIKYFGVENQQIFYLAYRILKAAFSKNIYVGDYRTSLRKAKEFIDEIAENFPNEVMKKHYLQKKTNAEILQIYRKEFEENMKAGARKINILETIEKMTEIISKVNNRKNLFTEILEMAVQVTKAERGVILLKNQETEEVETAFSYQIGNESLADVKLVGKRIIRQVLEKKKAVYSTNVRTNKSFSRYQSFVNLKIESVVCLPLLVHNQVLGTVYLDSRSILTFTPEDIKFLNIFAQIAASAIETSEKFCRLQEEKEKLSAYIDSATARRHPNIIGNSKVMEDLFRKIEQIAPTDVNVLVEGESGTGKELVAKEIHRLSKRNSRLFIPIDCGSLSEDIIESELFGHKKGAFTGALAEKKGLFEEADNGTLFLDEISNISLGTQAKLLRVIQEGEMKRLGENSIRKVNVRIIAASNIPLQKLVAEGKFRQDLYYRLSIFPIIVPRLAERNDDIVLLAEHFLQIYSTLHHRNIGGFSESALKKISAYDWPGNVRQLQNEIERAVIMFSDFDGKLPANLFAHLGKSETGNSPIVLNRNFGELVDDYKKKIIEQALEATNRNWTKTAQMLGISRQNLSQIYRRLNRQI